MKDKKSNEIKIKVKGGGNNIFSSILAKIVIYIMLAALALSMLSKCGSCSSGSGSGSGGNGLIKAPSWLEGVLLDRPDWLPDWFPSIFEKGENEGDSSEGESNGGNSSENPDEGLIYTIRFDANGGTLSVDYTSAKTDKNGKLSALPGAHKDGYIFVCWSLSKNGDNPVTLQTVYANNTVLYAQYEERCQHIDEDYDERCDVCGEKYYCIHIDEDYDETCDKCGVKIPNESVDPDVPNDCEHIDENYDRFCDVCGNPLSEAGGEGGNEGEGGDEGEDRPELPECTHNDENGDEICDECGELIIVDGGDGGGTDCMHRDANDDGVCDKCGELFDDGNESESEGGDPGSPECTTHNDENGDKICDVCGKLTGSGGGEGEYECMHIDVDGDGYCEECGEKIGDVELGCEHVDADDNGYCDLCGFDFVDGDEETEGWALTSDSRYERYYDYGYGGYVYRLTEEGIHGFNGVIPSEIDGMPVEILTMEFLSGCESFIDEVYIPETVKRIYCISLWEINKVYGGGNIEYIATWAIRANIVDIVLADNCTLDSDAIRAGTSISLGYAASKMGHEAIYQGVRGSMDGCYLVDLDMTVNELKESLVEEQAINGQKHEEDENGGEAEIE